MLFPPLGEIFYSQGLDILLGSSDEVSASIFSCGQTQITIHYFYEYIMGSGLAISLSNIRPKEISKVFLIKEDRLPGIPLEVI